jgi:two-component system alkaline phosphatase synthesis response regulator PhoP
MPARKSILLCDDDVHILRAAEIKFSRAGYDVRAATDGLEGWQEIERRCPDLVITDCQMPNMSGLQLVDRVRATPEVAHLPIIMLTAKGFELSHEDLAERSGIAAVVCKPFSPRELLRMAEELLATGTCHSPQHSLIV